MLPIGNILISEICMQINEERQRVQQDLILLRLGYVRVYFMDPFLFFKSKRFLPFHAAEQHP